MQLSIIVSVILIVELLVIQSSLDFPIAVLRIFFFAIIAIISNLYSSNPAEAFPAR